MEEEIKVDDRYSIKITSDGNKYQADSKRFKVEALRYGELWKNFTGDNLILAMAYKIQELQEELANKELQNI